MKRELETLFTRHMDDGGFVLAADMGYFPRARKHQNFIDIGNDEYAAGSIIQGLLSSRKNVFVYDVCGYIMRSSYISLFNRRQKHTGTLTIFGWGSGFAYNGCGRGHYPLDDIPIAELLNLNTYRPSTLEDFCNYNYYDEDKYVRLYDCSEWYYKKKGYIDAELYLVSHGWLLSYLTRKAINGAFGNKRVCILPYNEVPSSLDKSKAIYYTDVVQDKEAYQYDNVKEFTNPELFCLENCTQNWFTEKF